MKPLDAKELRVGMRVIKVRGERQHTTGVVRAVNVGENWFAVLFDGDQRITVGCNPKEFEVLGNQNLRLTGKPPPHTIARGSQ
jgi:hypothetical protein